MAASDVLDDAALLAALKARRQGVAAAFYDRAQPTVARTLGQFLRNGERGYPALLERVFFDLAYGVSRFRGELPLEAWMAVTVARTALRALRRRRGRGAPLVEARILRNDAALAKFLSGAGAESLAAAPTADERTHGVVTIELALRARAQRRTLLWATGPFVFAAVVIAVTQVGGVIQRAAGSAGLVTVKVAAASAGAKVLTNLASAADARTLAPGAQLRAGQRLETPPAGSATLQLSTGTSLELAGGTSLGVDSQIALERFSLRRGELNAQVVKLVAWQRFVVVTPDAELEVRGAGFQLKVLEQAEACGGGSRTRLEVSAGSVEVRARGSSVVLGAGQRWPQDCRG